MRFPILAAICALLLSACGSASRTDPLAAVQARKTLRVGVVENSAPFCVRGPTGLRGFDVDIATAIANHLGAQPEFVAMASSERLDAVASGRVDCVVAAMTMTRARERRVDFSVPYFQDGQMILVRNADRATITSYKDLAGRKVGVVTGTSNAETIAQVAPEAERVLFENRAAMRDALVAGSVDAITGDAFVLWGIQKSTPGIGLVGYRFSTEPYGVALPQGASDLRDAVNAALMDMWESGEWREIYDTWFGKGTSFEAEIRFAVPVIPR